ncbi:uncharacterized protein LOC143857190 isoform X2 [Tasmannia lanceolata]|uniref:uncharacterized protein LOC143857190 isoform X2 n=1 Tax=Tasmannia lanceolata TaxID=3420 RepID=UPI00406341CC
MPGPKLRACSIPDAMKPDQKAGKLEKEGHDSLDNFIRQAIGKEPFLPFSRPGESPSQWIQILHALDQQGTNKLSNGLKVDNARKERPQELSNDLSGWPLLSPKVQMHKCDKCSTEFCSPINYRRHIRVHRRSLYIEKDSSKNREFLGAFWDKLSLDEAKEILSFKNITLEEVAGSSILRALTSFIQKPGFSSLPQAYIKAGAALLDVVQSKPSRLPISSQDLFCILDDASEKTFLHAGTAISIQKFVFDGEAGKIGLEMKNLVACTSFLVEQKLVKAWVADKDAEALRCQKLLVEEEEAAQKRQAELLEKKRLKKLRQKEQKAKEQINVREIDCKEHLPDAVMGSSFSEEMSSPWAPSDSNSHTPDMDIACGNGDVSNCENADPQELGQQADSHQNLTVARPPVQKPLRNTRNGFHLGQVPMSKHGLHRDQRPASLASGHKVWMRKTKLENERESSDARQQIEPIDPPNQNDSPKVLIGSISVALGDCNGRHQHDTLTAALDRCDHQPSKQSNFQEKPAHPNSGQSGANKSSVKYWRPVGRHEIGGSMAVQSNKREAVANVSGKDVDRMASDESCLARGVTGANGSWRCKDPATAVKRCPKPAGLWLFSSHAAEAFLAQRWKEAIAADHVELVLLTPETELPDCLNGDRAAPRSPSDSCRRSVLGNAENRLPGTGPVDQKGFNKPKFRAKGEKVSQLKYIPRSRKNA